MPRLYDKKGDPSFEAEFGRKGTDPDPLGHGKGPFLPAKQLTWTPPGPKYVPGAQTSAPPSPKKKRVHSPFQPDGPLKHEWKGTTVPAPFRKPGAVDFPQMKAAVHPKHKVIPHAGLSHDWQGGVPEHQPGYWQPGVCGDVKCGKAQVCVAGKCEDAVLESGWEGKRFGQCGDGVCWPWKSCETCPEDCCPGPDVEPPEFQTVGVPPPNTVTCAPGVCGEGETCETCPTGCGCADGEVCHEAQCCSPDCAGMECGSDGCGGSCGECPPGTECKFGECACKPDCDGKICGDDGCDGTCGECPPGTECKFGECVCDPDCAGKACGDDGCGGSCGDCPWPLSVCVDGKCQCTPNCQGLPCGASDGCGGTCPCISCGDNICTHPQEFCFTCPEDCGECVVGCPEGPGQEDQQLCAFIETGVELAGPFEAAVKDGKAWDHDLYNNQPDSNLRKAMMAASDYVLANYSPEQIIERAQALLATICYYFPLALFTAKAPFSAVPLAYTNMGADSPYVTGNDSKIPVRSKGQTTKAITVYGTDNATKWPVASQWKPRVYDCLLRYLVYCDAMFHAGVSVEEAYSECAAKGLLVQAIDSPSTPPGYAGCI